MEDLNPLITRITSGWTKARQTFVDDPTSLQAIAPGMVVEQIDEAVTFVTKWATRKRAPKGFRPMYQVARIQLLSSLQSLATHADNVSSNPPAYIQSFLTSLAGAVSPLSTLSLFRDKSEMKESLVALDADLTQHLALMDTAQRELGEKVKSLSAAEHIVANIDSWASEAETSAQTIAAHQKTIEQLSANAAESAEKADEHADEVKSALEDTETLKIRLETLVGQGELHNKELIVLKKACAAQQELINSLLPNATAAGLSHSFAGGKAGYQRSLLVWGVIFLLAVLSLGIFGSALHSDLTNPTFSTLIIYFLHRLPWAGPIIWLGWFAAIQYGNVLRVKEDYAFKEATAIAFAGFRDHMEHLVKVNATEGHSAMENLAVATIHNLGQQPLRLLQKQSHDASPLERLMATLMPSRKSQEEG